MQILMPAAGVKLSDLNPEYVYERETTMPSMEEPTYEIKKSPDGRRFVVFKDHWSLYEYHMIFPHHFKDMVVANYGNFGNAFELGRGH